MGKKDLPVKTIERLSQYRRILLQYIYLENPHIFSHDLARTLGINPVHVRRDLMLTGISGSFKKGYPVFHLIEKISEVIDPEELLNVAFIGSENISSELLKHFSRDGSQINVRVIFTLTEHQSNISIDDIPVLPLSSLAKNIKELNISICVLNLPDEYVENIAKILVQLGIKKFVNLTSAQLQFSKDIEVEHFDLIKVLERIASMKEAF